MCGIMGYVGARSAAPLILDGLKRLEYRGYQFLAYHIAALRGLDVDQPRNLAKSVTVE